jgi:hypothetical protein
MPLRRESHATVSGIPGAVHNALERPVKSRQKCAAGARNNFAPAALGLRFARAAQRRR